MIKAEDLIRKFRQALEEHWGYIYGKTRELWSDEKQAVYVRESAGDPDRRNSVLYGGKWAGHWVTDCSGLFRWAFSELGGTIAHGSNSIWDRYCSARGTLASGKRADGNPLLPGTAVFTASGERHNHVGLYAGGKDVIEARGAEAGVTVGRITDRKWTAWGELKGVDYQLADLKGGRKMAKVVLPPNAGGTAVNMREQRTRSAKLVCRVPAGSDVDILEDCAGWSFIRFGSRTGWMMSDYLEREESDGGSSGNAAAAEFREAAAALDEIVRQTEILRDVLKRMEITRYPNEKGEKNQ